MAHVDYFLKIEGADGESTDEKHAGEIQLESWSFGGSNSATFDSGGGGGSGKVRMQDFNFTKKTDKASSKLLVACATGEHLKKAALTCRKAGTEQQEFLIIEFEPVLITSYQTGGSAGGDAAPIETLSMAYGKITYKYKEQKPDGSLGGEAVGGWDVTTNKKV